MSINQGVEKPEGAIVMSEPILPQPADHVFVLQLQESCGRPGTRPPNAFRSGEALISLEPGASWVGEWGIEPSPIRQSGIPARPATALRADDQRIRG